MGSAVTERGCSRFLVAGTGCRGVWFRESTRREAQNLNLCGHAINLPDGRVEVLAAGRDADIRKLAAWLQTGPADGKRQLRHRRSPRRPGPDRLPNRLTLLANATHNDRVTEERC